MGKMKTDGSFPSKIIGSDPDDSTLINERESLETKLMALLGTNGSWEEIWNTRKQLHDLDQREETANARLRTAAIDDPNAFYRKEAERSRLLAEWAENCARICRACTQPGSHYQGRMAAGWPPNSTIKATEGASRSQSRT
jgi:hypothetical protein